MRSSSASAPSAKTNEIPFFLEFVGYDPKGGDEKGFEFAKLKPEVVIQSMEEFSKPQYKVDVLKVEVPINANFVEGSSVFKGQKAYSREEALDHFRKAASVAKKPFIYLSAGVSNAQFIESLNMAAEAGHGLFGRAMRTRDLEGRHPGLRQAGRESSGRLAGTEGVKNINAVNAAIKTAKPWYVKAGVPQPAYA